MPLVKLGPLSDFPPNGLYRVETPHRDLAFAVAVTPENAIHVIDDLCTHANARLSEGWLEEGCVACPWHGAQFDLQTGQALSLPATESVATHEPIVRDDVLFIDLPANDQHSGEGLDKAHLDG